MYNVISKILTFDFIAKDDTASFGSNIAQEKSQRLNDVFIISFFEYNMLLLSH